MVPIDVKLEYEADDQGDEDHISRYLGSQTGATDDDL